MRKTETAQGDTQPEAEKQQRRAYHARPNDRFSLRSFVRDAVTGAVMGGLSSVAFYGDGKAVEALKRNISKERGNLRAAGKYVVSIDEINKYSFINTIDCYNRQGRKIDILSGTHGSCLGKTAWGSKRIWNRSVNNVSFADGHFYFQDFFTALKYLMVNNIHLKCKWKSNRNNVSYRKAGEKCKS